MSAGYARYGIYFVPQDTALAAFGARWLGWDITSGAPARQYDLPELAQITTRPRTYGFHATLKAPFRLVPGADEAALRDTLEHVARRHGRIVTDGLELTTLGRFLALTLRGDVSAVQALAADCVRAFDPFRAPLTEAELDRRRGKGLPPYKAAMLEQWGYPHVMEAFRFHMTLTDRLPKAQLPHWRAVLENHLPQIGTGLTIDAITLVGERADGRFETVHRAPLVGLEP
ncbi:DUF1045 domain-containing protein [Primorskyibacter sp. S187A]|uniref:DUF1045 domain-containing protein n=1 Tax=Primorskyibacter sp. S187A TaxID=3415130 RepID=UPI003C7D1290